MTARAMTGATGARYALSHYKGSPRTALGSASCSPRKPGPLSPRKAGTASVFKFDGAEGEPAGAASPGMDATVDVDDVDLAPARLGPMHNGTGGASASSSRDALETGALETC